MGAVVGLTCKGYRNTGSYGSPTWNEITPVRDLNLNLDKGAAEVKARLSTWTQNLPTLKTADLEFGIIADTAIDDYNALRDAYLNDTVVDVAVADGAIATTGTQYFRADYYATGFKRGEPLEEVATVDITMKLAYSSNAPAFTTVGS